MKIELTNYVFENEGSTQIWADLSILIDGITIRWHMIPSEWNEESGCVTFESGIGAPSDDYDLSELSENDRSLLLGERHDIEEIIDFEDKVKSALREQMKDIMSKMGKNFLIARNQQLNAAI